MPHDLDALAKVEWAQLVRDALSMKVLTVADRPVLKAAAQAYSTWWRAELAIRKAGGFTYETENTAGALVIKTRPEVPIASDAWRRYFAAVCELGMTPARRSKVSTVDPTEETSPEASYFQ